MGRDKGKFNKRGGRGGGSSRLATSAEDIELRNSRIASFDEQRSKRRAEADEAEGEVQDKMEEMTVDDEKKGDQSKKVEEPKTMSRKQREEADRVRKAEDYRRRHEAGLTEEYKRDMEKLAEVRKRREDAKKKAAAEKETIDAIENERKSKAKAFAAAVDSDDDSDSSDDDKKKKKSSKKSSKKSTSIPKLDKIVIKKMKPTQLKEALKTRDLDIQGNAKALLKRLLDYEESR
mmetsp:Transcript_22085/g.25127  ORF Transcript_22085/g.25127 Transcript_22085/m.25127 type:complete len:233 (+) Transcript_22085:101-799(+)